MKESEKYTNSLLEFIEKSPSCFHVIYNISEELRSQGFVELKETQKWNVKAGGKYYTVRNDSSLIAFKLPKAKKVKGFHIVASHSDSPTFKIKESPELEVDGRYIKLNTEKYGGMIMSTWFDRALSVAGRVAISDNKAENGVATRLVNIDRDLLVIPSLAIHMNRDINKGAEYNPQVDMLPIIAESSDSDNKVVLTELIAKQLKLNADLILGHDLFLYVRDRGRILGADGEFILSPKLDDLQCAFSSLKAFVESEPNQYIDVCAVFDNEEVGSGTKQGADSTFLQDVLERISENLGFDRNGFLATLAGSFLISADNAHAEHPNHPEKADPVNRPKLNGGIVIKYHGAQKYTTDAVSAAIMKELCNEAGVPYQIYTNRSDIVGGSTLGNISAAHVSVPSVDIGMPQLAMHSAVETAGSRDTEYAIKLLKVFYEK